MLLFPFFYLLSVECEPERTLNSLCTVPKRCPQRAVLFNHFMFMTWIRPKPATFLFFVIQLKTIF